MNYFYHRYFWTPNEISMVKVIVYDEATEKLVFLNEGAAILLEDNIFIDITKLFFENSIDNYVEEFKNYCVNNKYNKNKENSVNYTGNTGITDGTINYKNYYNTRFKFSIDYPDFLIMQQAPANNDGRIFKSADNLSSLTAYGGYNVLNDTAESLYNYRISNVENVTYTYLGEDFCVVSWTEGDYINYYYSTINDGVVSTFILNYHKSKADMFNDIVQRCYDSFIPGSQ